MLEETAGSGEEMIISRTVQSARKNIPYISLLLLLSCLITTVPQFFLGDIYSDITGSPIRFNLPWAISVTAFSHSPGILFQHLTGNVLVLISMGVIIEVVLGSNAFALISLTTFLSTGLLGLFRGLDSSHGASGIFWGYHTVVFFILVVYKERYGWKALVKEPFLYIAALLTAFNFIGINVIEVFFMRQRFFGNFGQTIHLMSLLCVGPYLLVSRETIQNKVCAFFNGSEAVKSKQNKASGVILVMICAVNLFSTIVIIGQSVQTKTISYEIMVNKDPEAMGIQSMVILFSDTVKENSEELVDYSVTSIDEKIEWKSKWTDARHLQIDFSRPVEKQDTVFLKYAVKTVDNHLLDIVITNNGF
jgi:membrane associated rhomboid family serine protease